MTDTAELANLPEPLVPAEVDLRGYEFMPFYGDRLLNSDFNARAADNDGAWRAGVTLWWKAWNQVPAASLPNDDVTLAMLAGFGKDRRSWIKVRTVALHGFDLCNDGRLYHRFLAPLAIEAYRRRKAEKDKKQRYRNKTAPGGDLFATGTGTGTGPMRGEERTGQEITTPHTPFALPEWIPVADWQHFEDMRKRVRKPMTDRARELIVLELTKFKADGFDPIEILNKSTRCDWQDVYRPKDPPGSRAPGGRQAALEGRNQDVASRFSGGERKP